MARTIGKRWIRRIKELVDEANKKNMFGVIEVFEYVKENLPEEVFDIWESAYSEIQGVSDDYTFKKSIDRPSWFK